MGIRHGDGADVVDMIERPDRQQLTLLQWRRMRESNHVINVQHVPLVDARGWRIEASLVDGEERVLPRPRILVRGEELGRTDAATQQVQAEGIRLDTVVHRQAGLAVVVP